MAYTSIGRVRLALAPDGDFASPSTAASLPDATIIEQIRIGDAEVDTYLSSRYVTPVVGGETNEIVSAWATNLAAWYSDLVYRKNDDLEETDPVQRRRQATIDQLQRVLSGEIDLQIPVLSGGNAAFMDYPGRLFDPTDWRPGEGGYHPEPYGPNWSPEWSRY